MKVGLRKPSVKRSIKARTTGKIKRSVKRSINPFYGKKGVGFIKNPERSIKNAIYHRTTFGVGDILKAGSSASKPRMGNGKFTLFMFLSIILLLGGLTLALAEPIGGLIAAAIGIYGIVYAVKRHKKRPEE